MTAGPVHQPIRRWSPIVIALLVAVRVGLLVGVFVGYQSGLPRVLAGDTLRYRQIADARGRPYRDFQVEFPPVSLGMVEVVATDTTGGTAARLGAVQLALDLAIAAMLLAGWGQTAAVAYLVLGLPLIPFVYFRIDLLSVALALGGVLLVEKRRDRLGGLALSLAVLAKVWPIVVAPILLLSKRRRPVVWFGASLVAGIGAWTVWGGPSGLSQVGTFREAQGWQIQSLIGSVYRLFSRSAVRLEAGADRVGVAPLWARGMLVALIVTLVFLVWVRSAGCLELADSVAPLTAVAVLLVLSPLLSPQYLTWLLPWAAISISRGERIQAEIVALAVLLSAFLVYQYGALVAGDTASLLLAVLVNVSLVAIGAFGLLRLGGTRLEVGADKGDHHAG